MSLLNTHSIRMKTILRTLAILASILAAMPAFAQTRDTELKVERRTLDRQDKLNRPKQNAAELTRGIRIAVKNTGLKPSAEGEVEWAILVVRPSEQRSLFSEGKEALKALKGGETAAFDVGAVPVQDIGNRRQDMEFRVVVRRGGAEVAKHESVATFSQQAESARPVEKRGKKKDQ